MVKKTLTSPFVDNLERFLVTARDGATPRRQTETYKKYEECVQNMLHEPVAGVPSTLSLLVTYLKETIRIS